MEPYTKHRTLQGFSLLLTVIIKTQPLTLIVNQASWRWSVPPKVTGVAKRDKQLKVTPQNTVRQLLSIGPRRHCSHFACTYQFASYRSNSRYYQSGLYPTLSAPPTHVHSYCSHFAAPMSLRVVSSNLRTTNAPFTNSISTFSTPPQPRPKPTSPHPKQTPRTTSAHETAPQAY
jgi:hypothetical protein